MYQTTPWPAVAPKSASSTSLRLDQLREAVRRAAPCEPLPSAFIALEDRRLLQLQPDVDGEREQDERDQERNPPAPALERVGRHLDAAEADDDQREEEAERRRRLDPARVVAALARAARARRRRSPRRRTRRRARGPGAGAGATRRIGASEADRRVRRQEADGGRRSAHDDDRDEERVLAADEVADPAEHEGAEGPHEEAGGVRDERGEQRRGGVARRKEERGEEGRQRRVEIEVVPLEHGAERRREDDPFFFFPRDRRRSSGDCRCHAFPPR